MWLLLTGDVRLIPNPAPLFLHVLVRRSCKSIPACGYINPMSPYWLCQHPQLVRLHEAATLLLFTSSYWSEAYASNRQHADLVSMLLPPAVCSAAFGTFITTAAPVRADPEQGAGAGAVGGAAQPVRAAGARAGGAQGAAARDAPHDAVLDRRPGPAGAL